MTLFKIDLMSKNNKQRGSYLYMPIVEINGEYFRCKSLLTRQLITKKDIDASTLQPTTKILPEFYKANGIIL